MDQASLYNQLASLHPLPLRCIIKKIEYKVVKHDIRVGTRLKGNDFSDSFVQLLAAYGQEGWDLKSVIREGGFMTLLIFGREVN